MAVSAQPVRRVILKFWEHAVERTEAEIAELKVHGLFVRDATPEDKLAPHDEAAKSRAAAAEILAAASAPAPGNEAAKSPAPAATAAGAAAAAVPGADPKK